MAAGDFLRFSVFFDDHGYPVTAFFDLLDDNGKRQGDAFLPEDAFHERRNLGVVFGEKVRGHIDDFNL